MSFNYESTVARVQIDNSRNIPFTPTPSLQNNTFLYGNRRALKVGETSLPIPVPKAGSPVYSYYQCYQLPQNLLTDPDALLAHFKACGYDVAYGYSDEVTLNNIGAYSPSNPTSGRVTLYFSGQALNVAAIANRPLTGTINIAGTPAITGSVVSVSTGSFTVPINTQFTADTTNSNATLTNLNINTALLEIGSSISGAGIPVGATILTKPTASSITISAPATATAVGVTVSYSSVTPLDADTQIVINSSSYTGLQIGKNLEIDFTAQSSLPDEKYTEPFVMNLWSAVAAMSSLTSINQNATVGAPAIYFAILPDAASTNFFQPTGNVMPMGIAPTSAAVGGGYTTLSIPITADYASFVPLMQLGISKITQATSNAEGIVFQSVLNGAFLQVQLQNVTGTFNTTDLISLTLDNTTTIMSLQSKYFSSKLLSLFNVPLIYEVDSNTDITSTYNALYAYVGGDNSGLNAPVAANVGQGNCRIVFVNQNIPQASAESSLPTAIDNQYYLPVYYPFVKRAGVPNQTPAQTACAMAAVYAASNYPFNPLNDIVVNGVAVSPNSQDWIDMSVGGVADTVQKKGWAIIAINANGLPYLFLGRAGQTIVNNVPDREFYPSYVLDTKNYYRLALRLICLNNGVGQVRQTSEILQRILLNIVDLNIQMAQDGILANVERNNQLIRVQRSTQNPLGISIYAPIQQNVGLFGVYGEVVNYSINFTL